MSFNNKIIQFHNLNILNKNSLKNNRLYLLPLEIQYYIFYIYNSHYSNIIIRNWYLYLMKKNNLAINLLSFCKLSHDLEFTIIDISQPQLDYHLNYALRLLSGREDLWWLEKWISIINSLINYRFGDYFINIDIYLFSSIERLVCQLLVKFNIFENLSSALDYYYLLYRINQDTLITINQSRFISNVNFPDAEMRTPAPPNFNHI